MLYKRQKLTGKKPKPEVTPCYAEYHNYTELIATNKENYHINTSKAEIKFLLGKKTDFFSCCNKSQEKAEGEGKTVMGPLTARSSKILTRTCMDKGKYMPCKGILYLKLNTSRRCFTDMSCFSARELPIK